MSPPPNSDLRELVNATFFHPSYALLFYPFLLKALLGNFPFRIDTINQ